MSEIQQVYDRRRFILRTLSPVHVGNGFTFKKDIEIRNDLVSGRIHVLDMETIFDLMASEDCGSIRSFSDMIFFLKSKNIPPNGVSFHIIETQNFPASEIRMMIRDGAGRPLVPGSSIKGAIRTALVRTLLDQSPDGKTLLIRDALNRLPQDPKNAAQALERRLLRPSGTEPNDDLFRCVAVYDGCFPAEKLKVSFVHINSPHPEHPRRTTNFLLAVEAIVPDCEAEIEIALDKYLLSRTELGFNKFNLDWLELTEWVKNHTFNLLNKEIKHYRSLGWNGAVKQLEQIREKMVQAQGGSIPLRMGWGIGWCGTTGELLQSPERIRLLDHYERQGKKIGKYGSTAYRPDIPFPKSRRLVKRNGSDESMDTFGWILLEPAGDRHIPVPPPYRPDVTVPASPVTAQPIVPPEVPAPNPIWHNCLLAWDAGSGGILTASCSEGRAEARQKEAENLLNSLPYEARERIKKRKQIRSVTVEVQKLGNAWIIKTVAINNKG